MIKTRVCPQSATATLLNWVHGGDTRTSARMKWSGRPPTNTPHTSMHGRSASWGCRAHLPLHLVLAFAQTLLLLADAGDAGGSGADAGLPAAKLQCFTAHQLKQVSASWVPLDAKQAGTSARSPDRCRACPPPFPACMSVSAATTRHGK